MCELCRRNPCDSRCPNAPDPQPIYICCCCEEGIFAGETVYEIDGHYYCEGCIDDMRFVAEEEEYEPDEDRAYDEWRDRQLDGFDDAEYNARRLFGSED